ncbi:hypothetical protein D0Z07_8882 [Hyphodiscus hymeniophilus]|uniref:BTB domain-containing protein n=1 Tax=Hyphodiscus hymeniophilus TaxID=353542 RepID=A0A9P6VDL8_9HELO|nr:hypothetical protein D0Z07_8882 [Hyphodiscus hymeniophilus]
METNRPNFNSPFGNPPPAASSWSNLNTPSTSAPPSAAGRKRSRDEAAINLEDEYFPVHKSVPIQPEVEEEWEYGEGMTLIKPCRSGYLISAGSQTGTWAEEKAEEEKAKAAAALDAERPIMRSAKSQRLDLTSTPIIAEEVMSNGTLVTPITASPSNGHVEPTVDDFTRHLGIGWSLISVDADIQAAARGWTRYIDNHFPVTDAKIRLQSKGLASYLVEANEGYFLFGEDLKQGRLVSKTLEQTFVSLQGPIPKFEGEDVLNATETPKANGGTTPVATGHVHELSINGVDGVVIDQPVNGQPMEVEMDMMSDLERGIYERYQRTMVSQVEPSHALARGPSSVISRPSSSARHRRHNRSHAGGSSYVPQNEFPVFTHTGDVEIVVKAGGQSNRYLLHRLILTQCSGFFEASTSQEWSRATTDGSGAELARIGEDSGSATVRSKEVRKRWRYELDPGSSKDDVPMLVQKENTSASLFGSQDARPPPVRNKPPSSNPSFFRSVANLTLPSSHAPAPSPLSQEEQDLLKDYDNLFRIFYNYAPSLDPIDIAIAYVQCKSLLTLADLYDALAVVGPRIDHHLLQFQSRLWKQIAKYPSSYLKLGYLAQSKSIFQEALIHVVGAWPMGERHIRHQLPDSVLEIIEDKVEDLADMVGKIEGRLFRLSLTTSRGERITPHNSYLDWLAVSFFRQWVTENTAPPPPPPLARSLQSRGGHHGQDRNNNTHHGAQYSQQQSPLPSPLSVPQNPNVGRIYRLLGTSPSAYLNHDECKRFLKLTPEIYSRESLKKFEKRLEELKGAAREIVRPLMQSSLSGEGSNTAYLVCTVVDDRRDLPWLD